jgi:hypothetical protein
MAENSLPDFWLVSTTFVLPIERCGTINQLLRLT